MKVLIFGGLGFVGRSLENRLLAEGHDVYTASRTSHDKKNHFKIDITKASAFESIDIKPNIVLNCASRIPQAGKSSRDADFVKNVFTTNVIGGLNIANWSRAIDASLVINYSTLVVVNKPWPVPLREDFQNTPRGPHSAYCMSKLSQESIMDNAVAGSATRMVHLRLSAVYGNEMSPEGILFYIINTLKDNSELNLTNANSVSFDFINAEDIARVTNTIITRNFPSGIFNLGSGESISLLELAHMIKDILNSNRAIKNIETGSKPNYAEISIDKLSNALGAKPVDMFTPLKEGLTQMINHKFKS